ncbi:MAG TPA: response regulator transcription factor, partial [Cellulomonadaceae bacterium]|nr:response regulator transcription factor [Cellulomonadaceae bacterium]
MIIDDHEVVRRGIAEVIERADGMTVVAEAASVADGVRRAGLVHPQVMLVDLQLPDGTGIDLMKAVRETQPEVRAIVLTSFDDDDALAAALEAGASAYLLKSVRGAEITDVVRVLDAVEEVMRAALVAGGTSFDALYVNVNGASGYFDRSLAV